MQPQTHQPTPSYSYASPDRKTQGRTVIAQISDLHFTSATNWKKDEWKALADDLADHRVDFLAVTGDLIDNSVTDNFKRQGVITALDKVLEFLSSLCVRMDLDPKVAMGVVPGNHDFRFKGVYVPRWIFEKTVYYDAFYERFGEFYKSKLLPSLNCGVFTFDSNTPDDVDLNFASGRINNDDILEFSNTLKLMNHEHRDELLSCSKIVLVHHHPMPIAATELDASFIDSEKYHLLKNAGLFMTEMVRHKVNLILHGHKHYPAWSKATFPLPGEAEHSVAVVAAGSVSVRGRPYSSYNLITIRDSGEIELNRQIREALKYGKSPQSTFLYSYEDTRHIRNHNLAAKVGAKLRIEKYVRLTTIVEDRSGDVVNREIYGNASSYRSGENVAFIEQRYSSKSGTISETPQFTADSIRVNWEWEEQSIGRGKILFNPPISDSNVSFEVRTETKNAIYFNRQDRLHVTKKNADEAVRTRVREVCDLLVIKVSFPDSFIPPALWAEVLDSTGERDLVEEKYVTPRITTFDDDNSVVLTVEEPLLGYTYTIVWSLPESEEEELQLPKSDRIFADEIIKQLLALRTDGWRLNQVQQRLHNLANEIISVASVPIGAEDFEILVHCFDPELWQLVCVAAIGTMQGTARRLESGESIIGQAYKRRLPVTRLFRDQDVDDPDPDDYDAGHVGVLSVPLFYPLEGFRVGVVTLATHSKTAAFLRLLNDELSDEDHETFDALVEHLMTTLLSSLLTALGLQQPWDV
jgi:3',5'-cyclic AMP phosphodiesterase CpdA